MSLKNWFIKHYLEDKNESLRNITLKLFYIAFFTFIIVMVFFLSVVKLVNIYVNVPNICEYSEILPDFSIKWYHYTFFGLAFVGFLYWIDYGVYLLNKYRRIKGI